MAMNDDDILNYIEDSRNYRALGTDLEFDYDDNDMLVLKPYVEPSLLENIGGGLQRVGAALVGTGAGAVGAALGLPTDLVGLINGIKDAVSAEDGKKLDAFSRGFSEFSKGGIIPGSEFYKDAWDKTVDSLETYSPKMKEDAKAAFTLGEFIGLERTAVKGAKAIPKIAKFIKPKLQEVGEQAQERLDADQGSMTMSSMGVGEMGKMVDKGLSKLAPKLSVKDSVVNYVQSPSLMSRDELVKSLDSDPTVVKKSIKALKDLGKVNNDNTVTIYRRVPLRKGEELKDETIISGSHDVRAVRDADKALEGITTFDKFGQPKATGEEVFVKYKVPIDRIKGYLPEVGEYTRGTQARIQRAMQGKIDEKRKQGLSQFTKLKNTKNIFEKLVQREKEIIADVSGIKPEKVDRNIIRGFGFDEIIEGKIKTADEFKKAYPNVMNDEVARVRDAIVSGGDKSLAINPKTGKKYTVEEFRDLDKQKTQENIDKIREDFGLPSTENKTKNQKTTAEPITTGEIPDG